MAKLLEVPLYELITKKSGYLRYTILIFRTIFLLVKKKPTVIFVQNPSMALALIATIARKLMRYQLFVDAHNSAIDSLSSGNRIVKLVSAYLLRKPDHVIVTNASLARIVEEHGGSPIVATDPIPNIPFDEERNFRPENEDYFLFICSWANDEPFSEVIEAFSRLGETYKLLVTGNYKKVLKHQDAKDISANIKLLGFVDEETYLHYLLNCIASIDLTTRENCLVCGAYESIAAKRPCLISDTPANRETFKNGFVYTKNTNLLIENAVRHIADNLPTLQREISIENLRHKAFSSTSKERILTAVQRHKKG
ncbi:glycosyltransferase [Marinimicrobium sp. ARAG 43.8]|uniref:glycosyltransferase n=1 Tax=Marinimicrobium sp. ARAG 43.8 TaxID=3418719 RepID=UPI003CF00F0B